MGQCCVQGGSCRKSPARVIKNDNGGVVRINVLYYGRAWCCGPRNGVSEKDALTCPEEVVAAEQINRNSHLEAGQYNDEHGREMELRVKQIWKDFMGPQGALLEVQRKHLKVGRLPQCCFDTNCGILLLVVTVGLCCPMFCKNRKKKVMAWDADMRVFLRDFNEKLKDLGMWVKPQSRDDERWLAFALTPEDGVKLEGEPHVFGWIKNDECWGGVNENECCMRPPECL
eukprot:GEMP01070088.1.p1 GENE.GEMP01070088.1~~GEMP01070088.1.p1  ORF type:complete len:228 (+),score=44.23 GEMP01070088.1:84-767(+)